MLTFPLTWRIEPPPDGRYINALVPEAARKEFFEFALASAPAAEREQVLFVFKEAFHKAAGQIYSKPSSSFGYAKHDLIDAMQKLEGKPPQFIEAFANACTALTADHGATGVPDATLINTILTKHDMGYRIEGDELVLRDSVQVVPVQTTSLLAEARQEFADALKKSEEYLAAGKETEAAHAILWLLESIATEFSGKSAGIHKIQGHYFIDVMNSLQKEATNPTRQFAVRHLQAIYGFLSSPSGGKIRHGASMSLPPLTRHEATLFVNLVRTYVAYLLDEYELLNR